MNYTTTQLRPTRSYPTYQFYAQINAGSIGADEIFHICILETLRWLRSRLRGFEELPPEILLPEPEDYRTLNPDQLHSFSFTRGITVDVVYAEKRGIWSFRIAEADMGANLGSANERQPVIGRTFQTDIAFTKHDELIEVGVRTLCSDPFDCDVPCEVFRPTVVKAIAEHPEFELQRNGCRLNGKPFLLDSKNAVEHFVHLFEDTAFDLPLVLITESGYEETVPVLPDPVQLMQLESVRSGFGCSNLQDGFVLDLSKVEIKTNIPKSAEKPAAKEKPAILNPAGTKRNKRQDFQYERLAASLLGFAVVVYVHEKCIPLLKNKCGIELCSGDIAVYSRGEETEHHPYKAWSKDLKAFFYAFRSSLMLSPKRAAHHFGNVEFHSEARLQELRERRHEAVSLEEKCDIYKQENKALKQQTQELQQQNADLRLNSENLRNAQKRILTLENELNAAEQKLNALQKLQHEREEAYSRSADLSAFYRMKADLAAGFPTVKDKVCDWAEEHFSDGMILTADAKSALRKYDGALDLRILCDGLLYLNAYAKYRRGELDEAALLLYAERYSWEVSGCGKEALRMRHEDYLTTHAGENYLLDQHIKHGVSSQALLRIYFCWDEKQKKLIIGYMPGHLATVKRGT